MKTARMLGATVVLLGTVTLFGSPMAFACDPDMTGCSSSGSSSSDGSSSSGSSSGSFTSGSDSSGSDTSGSTTSCDSACQKKKDAKKKKTTEPEPSSVIVIPPQRPTPRAPVRQAVPVAPPTDFAPDAPAETPVLEQDAVSVGSGELIANPTATSGDSAGVESAAQTSETNEGDAGDPTLTSSASPTATSGDSPPWALIAGGLAVGLLGAGLAFAPSRKPPLPPPPPMNPMNHYPGY
jgi:hypothetical protein